MDESTSLPLFENAKVNDGRSSLTIALALSTFIAECGSFTYGCAISFTSPAESGITTDLGLSTSQYAVFGSIMTFGSLASVLISGKTADFIGRRRTMWLSQFFCTIGWLAIILAEVSICSLSVLCINYCATFNTRLCFKECMVALDWKIGNGIWSWICFFCGAGVCCRNHSKKFAWCINRRVSDDNSFWYLQMTIAFGISLTYIIGSFVSWRILAFIGSVSGLIQIVGLFCIPESPRWLAKVGRDEEVQVVLQKLRSESADISTEAEEIQEYTKTCESFEKLSKHGILDLFQRKYAQALIVGSGLMIVQQFGGATAIVSYASDIFKLAGFSTSVGSFGMAIIQIPAVITGVFLMDTWGRRPLTMLSLGGMCLSAFLLGSSFLLKDINLCEVISPVLVFIGLLLYSIFYSIAMGAIPYVIMAEIFPINMKGLAGPLLLTVNSICSMVTTYTFLFGLDWSAAGVFYFFCVICGGGLVFVIKLVPETKCKTLEEIQESMVHFK